MSGEERPELVLVTRKAGFSLPTACPVCLPVYCYLRLAGLDFKHEINTANPDSDHLPYVEYGNYVSYNDENGGAIGCLNKDDVVQLDSQISRDSFPDWVATKAMISSWLADALEYELWVSSEKQIAYAIYFSDLPWPIGKILHWNHIQAVKKLHKLTEENAADKEQEIYNKAKVAYEALSNKLDENVYFFDGRPTSVDALFLGHAAFVLNVLPDASVLKSNLLQHENLVRFVETYKTCLQEANPSAPGKAFDVTSSKIPKAAASSSSSARPKRKEKRERTEEEKAFRRRTKYFLAAQAVAIVIFLSLFGGSDSVMEDIDEDGFDD